MKSQQEDLGRQVLEYVYKTMAIDEQWSVREPLGFTWWAHRLAQRIWAEPLTDSSDPPGVQVYAETAFLRNVPHTSSIEAKVDILNKYASLNAFIWNPTSNRISVRCSAGISSDSVGWMRPFFSAAVAIQRSDAHVKAVNALNDVVGGEIDTSAHPQHGPRKDMDDMLNVIEEMFAPLGRKPSPFRKSDFEEAARMEPNPSVLSNAGESGLTAEFLYYDGEKFVLLSHLSHLFPHLFRRQKPKTALLTIDSSVAHPQLGSGAFWKLTLPAEFSHERSIQVAADLNRAESRAETDPYLYSFGAWCSDPNLNAVSHVMFMPAAIHKSGIINPFFVGMAARSQWARKYLSLMDF